NGRTYRMSDYPNLGALKEAIKNVEGSPVQRRRYSWEPDPFPEPPPEPMPVKRPAQIIEFPDIDAQFPGGRDSLNTWIEEHLVYPEVSETTEGRVFVQFVVW